MLVTEEDAVTRYCPQKMNLAGIPDKERKCGGSQCMAWRWVITYTPKSSDSPNAGKVHRSDHGYCGLAGNAGKA